MGLPEQETTGCDGFFIQISLLGGLSMTIGKQTVKDSSSRSHQLWSLLEYLIAFRHKTILPQELYQALWGDHIVDNPASALKNLVYRVRTLLSGHHIPFAKSIIMHSGNSYQWNNAIPCLVDAEELERLHRAAIYPALPVELQIQHYQRAVQLYAGDFLSDSDSREWVLPLRRYYRAIYTECVDRLMELLWGQNRLKDLESVCVQALEQDRFREPVHRYLLLALTGRRQHARAAQHYQETVRLYQQELGVPLPTSLREMYRQIVKTPPTTEADLDLIAEELRENRCPDGAFVCDYTVFQSVFQVLSRSATRTGQSLFLVLFTLSGREDMEPESSRGRQLMDALLRVIQVNTRHCDVVSRFSACQYVVLLSASGAEQCDIVVTRIRQMCRKHLDLAGVELHAGIRPADSDAP